MNEQNPLLVLAQDRQTIERRLIELAGGNLRWANSPADAMGTLAQEMFAALVIDADFFDRFLSYTRLMRNQSVVDMLPIGVVLIDAASHHITWHNRRFRLWCVDAEQTIGENFFKPLGNPEIIGDDPSPFHSARLRRRRVCTLLRTPLKLYLQMEVVPIFENDTLKQYLIILQDYTESTTSAQKLRSLQDAGRDLANLSASDIRSLSVEERIELLKAKIIEYTKDILHYDKIEIRLLSHEERGRLDSLLAVGLEEEAMRRVLYAYPENNGITGIVAYTGTSMLIEDAEKDQRFLVGATGAKSAMTVPLLNSQQKVIGTFNVESVEKCAFVKKDLEFLETFGRDVAAAIHTLELLSVEQNDATLKSLETIHRNVARPINSILNNSARLLSVCRETPQAMDEIIRGVESVQNLAREIMLVIQKVGEQMAPSFAAPIVPSDRRPLLFDRRILVVDEDESVGVAVNGILFKYGCLVEFAPDVQQALRMSRGTHYDVFICDIRPGTQSGYDFLIHLQELLKIPYIPLILMKGYGYDSGHITVKAKQAGVLGFLAKPFILDQMIANIEKVVMESQRQNGDRWPIGKQRGVKVAENS